jgi:membrane protein YqaA with SNARE-associated domain
MDSLMWLGLLALFLICFFGSGPVPLPLTVTVMWLGQFHFPVLVVLVATLGTLTGWICLEGVLRRWVHARPQITQKIPVAYQKFFLRRTGFWLFVLNALPFPWDFMRFLALLNNYNRTRLLVILTVSRLVRNTILVMLGSALAGHQLLFWLVLIGFLIVPLLAGRLMPRLTKAAPE